MAPEIDVKRGHIIPSSIFSGERFPLEAVSCFLKEEGSSVKQISILLNRSTKTIYQAISNGRSKQPGNVNSRNLIPTGIFCGQLTIFEAVVSFLVEAGHLNYSETARILGKDPRTVWTVYKRAEKKKTFTYIAEKCDHVQVGIPVSAFVQDLSPLECMTKHLVEQCSMSIKQAAAVMHRSDKTIYQAYSNARKKHSPPITEHRGPTVPFSVFSSNMSCFETVILYLVDDLHLSIGKIGQLINRDARALWTVLYRARKKRGDAAC